MRKLERNTVVKHSNHGSKTEQVHCNSKLVVLTTEWFSLMTSLYVPPGEKQFGEQSQRTYYLKAVKTNANGNKRVIFFPV